MEDTQGSIWIGTMYGGVSRYDRTAGRAFTNFTQNGDVEGIEVASVYEDKAGNIWFPAENFGVYRFSPAAEKAGKAPFTNFYTNEGLITNGILCFLEDNTGRFWLGGWGGLFRFDRAAEQAGQKPVFSVTKNGPWN